MGFIDSIVTCYKKSFTISGRASRAEYWWFMLYFYLLCFVVVGITETKLYILSIPIGILLLFSFIPAFTVRVRRLHDTEHSGWNILWGAIPYLGFIGGIYLLILECTGSDFGENDYGQNPYDQGYDEENDNAISDNNEVEEELHLDPIMEGANNNSVTTPTPIIEEAKPQNKTNDNMNKNSFEKQSSEWEEI